MIESETRDFVYRGKPARISVIRNDGNCWGRIVTASGEKLDVVTRKDQYDEPDDDALEAFIRASRNPGCVEPAIGWL